jgi:hypothetical protein
MADQFSAEWWNEQASALGGLTRDEIIALSGVTVSTVWNPDGTIAIFWYKDAENRVPGLRDAGLALGEASAPAGFDVHTVIGSPDYPSWAYFVSQVGFVAPGATAPWQPTLAPTYTAPVASTGPTPPPGYEALGAALARMETAYLSGAPYSDVNQLYAGLIQQYIAARDALGASHPFVVYATRIVTEATVYVRGGMPAPSVIPLGWSTFGSPSWPATWIGSAELFVEDVDLWRAAPVLVPEAMLAPGRAMWIDRAANRIDYELEQGDPVFPGLYQPPAVYEPVPSPFAEPPNGYYPPRPPTIWETVDDEDGAPVGPPTMGPQGGGPSPTTLIPEEPGPLPPPAPGASKLLYAGAIGLGLVLLLGGRKNRS